MERKTVVSPSYLTEAYYKGQSKAETDLKRKRESISSPPSPLKIPKLKKMLDDIFFNGPALDFGDIADDLFGPNGAIAKLITELEKLQPGNKPKFGGKNNLGGIIADLKDFNAAGIQLTKVMDKMYYNKLQKVNFWTTLFESSET